MKFPATLKIGIATAVATWASPKLNAMVTPAANVISMNDDDIPDAPNMIVPLTGIVAAFSYAVLSLVFGGEVATLKGAGGAT